MSTVSEILTRVLNSKNFTAPDVTGTSTLTLPASGVSLDFVNEFVKNLIPGDASLPDILPGLDAIPVVIKACTFTDTGLDFDGAIDQWELGCSLDTGSSAIGFSADFTGGAAANPLRLGRLLAHAGLAVPEFDNVVLEKVEVRAVLRDRIYTLDLAIQELLTLQNFAVVDAELRLFYIGGDGDSSLTGSVVADALLGAAPAAGSPDDRLRFQVSALYDGPGLGWTFTGSVGNVHLRDVLAKFGVTESRFDDFTVTEAKLSYNTGSKELEFSFDGVLALNQTGNGPEMKVDVKLTKAPGGGYDKFFSGQLTLSGTEFDLVLDQSAAALSFIGAYRHTGGDAIQLSDLTKTVFPLPSGLDIGLQVKNALFAFQKIQTGKNFLVLVDTDANIDLSGLGTLPLIGPAFQGGQPFQVSLVALASAQDTAHPFDVTALRALLPAGSPSLADPVPEFDLLTTLQFGDLRAQVDIGIDPSDAKSAGTAPPAVGAPPVPAGAGGGANPAANPASATVQWVKVGKSFGPLAVQQVGLSFQNGVITVLLDAALSVAGLTLSVEGLGVTYDLPKRLPVFTLRGIGLDLRQDPLEIGGGFLNVDGDFAGKVVIRTEKFAISALGAFTFTGAEPSMLIYGFLDYPLGGPAFFFIEGLAAGFGYNRSFRLPAIDDVRQFPLVQDAIDPGAAKAGIAGQTDKAVIAAQLGRLHDFIAPSVGEYFLAVGIKFTSFKLIESFVLLAAAFGKKFELDLIGTSTYQNPPVLPAGLPAFAYIELNLVGRFAPDEGVLSVEGKLTDKSYIYSNLCQISGGFAFYSWFHGDHAGDFVLSVGGYHPRFAKPAWYPDVPRMELKYQITPEIYVKGSAYFALTPSTCMAGGALEARFESGSLAAWFLLTVDFLIGWQPYHYDASVHLTIGARWKVFSTEAHASLEIWGPEFTGIAHVDWTIFSFTITFGNSTSRGPAPIAWADFKKAFLPPDDKVVTLRIAQGAIGSTGDVPVVNPAQLTVDIDTLAPVKRIVHGGTVQAATATFGVAPMDHASVNSSDLTIVIDRLADVPPAAGQLDLAVADATLEFDFDAAGFPRTGPISKKLPQALWGNRLNIGMDRDSTLEAVAGYRIAAKIPSDGSTVTMLRGDAAFTLEPTRAVPKDGSAALTYAVRSFTGTDPDRSRADAIRKDWFGADASRTHASRAALLAPLGFDALALGTVNKSLLDSFTIAPQVVTVA